MNYTITLDEQEEERLERSWKKERSFSWCHMNKQDFIVYMILRGLTVYETENYLPHPSDL